MAPDTDPGLTRNPEDEPSFVELKKGLDRMREHFRIKLPGEDGGAIHKERSRPPAEAALHAAFMQERRAEAARNLALLNSVESSLRAGEFMDPRDIPKLFGLFFQMIVDLDGNFNPKELHNFMENFNVAGRKLGSLFLLSPGEAAPDEAAIAGSVQAYRERHAAFNARFSS